MHVVAAACRIAVLLSIAGLCNVAGATEAGLAPAWRTLQERIGRALLKQKVIDVDRALVHLGPICDVALPSGAVFHVIEARELVHGGPSPRGVNQMVLADRALRVTARAELGRARPLYCKGDAVVLDMPIEVSGS